MDSPPFLGGRVRELRRDVRGGRGGPRPAEVLRIADRERADHEAGATMAGRVRFRFIGLTDADPHWLLTGEGGAHRGRGREDRGDVRGRA